MKLKFKTEKIKKFFQWKNLMKYFFRLLDQQGKIYILIAVMLATGYCIFIWYNYIYHPEWSEARKQAYTRSVEHKVIFNKSNLKKVVADFEKRKTNFQATPKKLNDIFRLKN